MQLKYAISFDARSLRVSTDKNNGSSDSGNSSVMSYSRIFVVGLLAVLLLSLGVSAVRADSLSSSTISPSSGTPNTIINITVNASVSQANADDEVYVVVQAPDGSLYLYDGLEFDNFNSTTLQPPLTATCEIPFGGAGTLSSTAPSPLFVFDCSGSNANKWSPIVNSLTIQDFVSDCPSAPTTVTDTPGAGSTAQTGKYQVFVCMEVGSSGLGASGSFTINSPSNPNSVPEFPLGLGLLMVMAVPALLFLKRNHVSPAA